MDMLQTKNLEHVNEGGFDLWIEPSQDDYVSVYIKTDAGTLHIGGGLRENAITEAVDYLERGELCAKHADYKLIEQASHELMAAEQQATQAQRRRDDYIREALRAGLSPTNIAAAARVTRGRLYQIRDEQH